MRLIDGDALFAVVKGHHDLYNGATNPADKARRDECLQVMCDINDAPTIDAISVEWLREFDLYYAGISGGTKYMNELVGAWQNAQYAEQIEKHIMSWAAEHPEPVYPTWGEWLESIGVAEVGSGMLSIHPAIAEQPIPASFAREHGIEPKEE